MLLVALVDDLGGLLARVARRGIEDVLLEPFVHVERALQLGEEVGAVARAGGGLDRGEQLAHGLVILLEQFDGIHVRLHSVLMRF